MNYLETGLPHQDLYRKKSDFKPPRYKPLCSLGRRYLGLEPLSKTEIDSIINRLCQPKKAPEPEDLSNFTRKVRPIISGTGRFAGRKRMTGGQISNMVERLTKRKTEAKGDTKDNKTTTEQENDQSDSELAEHDNEISTKRKEMPNVSSSRGEESVSRGRNVHFERRESTVAHSKDVNQCEETVKTHDRPASMTSVSPAKLDSSLTIGSSSTGTTDKKHRQNHEEEKYESLYYRGIKTEIARKALNQQKRSSVHMIHSNKAENVKSAKTELLSAPHQHSKLDDVHNRRQRVKTA